MDLNALYHDHQLLLIRAARTSGHQARAVHLTTAQGMARTIAGMQDALGASAAPQWAVLGRASTPTPEIQP